MLNYGCNLENRVLVIIITIMLLKILVEWFHYWTHKANMISTYLLKYDWLEPVEFIP